MTDASRPTAQFATEALSIVVHPTVVPNVLVANGGSGTVTDYPLSQAGNGAPLFTLDRGNKLSAPSGVAVDTTGRLYVVNSGSGTITEFTPDVTSSSGPVVTIAGSNTGLSNPTAIALDRAGRIYVTSQTGDSVSVFAAGASGNAAPIATIAGAHTGLSGPAGATVTGAGDLWVANASDNSLTEYAPGATGDAAPIATVVGAATDLNSPVGIGQDEHGNLLVANLYGESITRFAPGASGNASPIGVIAGGNTTLDFPRGVDVDSHGRIYVPNQFGKSIAVFAADATGSVAPVATIAGRRDRALGARRCRGRPAALDPHQAPARRHRQARVPRDTACCTGYHSLPLVTDARSAAGRPPSQPRRDALRRPTPPWSTVGDDHSFRCRTPEDGRSSPRLADYPLPEDWAAPHLQPDSSDPPEAFAIPFRTPRRITAVTIAPANQVMRR